MKFVADTNIFLAVALHEPERDRIIEATSAAAVLAPDILPYEVGNALSAMVKRGKLTTTEALRAERAVSSVAVRLVPADVRSALKLALEHGIYAYDAYFLQSALAYSCPLLTLDRRMNEVAKRLGVEGQEMQL
jgi:predicted nucleic acid-binding protein